MPREATVVAQQAQVRVNEYHLIFRAHLIAFGKLARLRDSITKAHVLQNTERIALKVCLFFVSRQPSLDSCVAQVHVLRNPRTSRPSLVHKEDPERRTDLVCVATGSPPRKCHMRVPRELTKRRTRGDFPR